MTLTQAQVTAARHLASQQRTQAFFAARKARLSCAECYQPAPTPVRVPAEVAERGEAAAVFCGQACVEVRDEREQNAEGAL